MSLLISKLKRLIDITECKGGLCVHVLLSLMLGLFFLSVTTTPVYAQERPLLYQNAINSFYEQRSSEPFWITGRKLNPAGESLRNALSQSWEHGLNPNTYYAKEIKYILSQPEYQQGSDTDLPLKLELLLTSGYVLYARDLSGMRVTAQNLGLDVRDWKQRVSAYEILSLLPHSQEDMKASLIGLGPQTATYQRLKQEMHSIVAEQRQSTSNETSAIYFEYTKVIRPGDEHGDVSDIRTVLGVEGPNDGPRYIYDSELLKAVKSFQKDNNLAADGIIGERTIAALNRNNNDKLRQIIVNMERLRWISDEKPARFIVVNIPTERLWAMEDGELRFTMPVAVGTVKRPTIPFVTKIHGVRFNPTWTVPETIKKEDIWPRLQENPNYLTDKGMELFDGYGADAMTLDPSSIEWQKISEKELLAFNMVQIPGSHNPLGRIRVLMPNSYDIYLHDTNDKSVFSSHERAVSSGCVRMEEPEKVALFALEKDQKWNEQKDIDAILETNQTRDVYVSDRVTVYLLYYTLWLGPKRQIIYGNDIYDRDTLLWKELKKLDGIPEIRDNIGRLSTSLE